MASQARILSFDEARSSGGQSGNRRGRSNPSAQISRARRGDNSSLLSYLSEDDFSTYTSEKSRSSRHRGSAATRNRSRTRYGRDDQIEQYEQARRASLVGEGGRDRREPSSGSSARKRRLDSTRQAAASRRGNSFAGAQESFSSDDASRRAVRAESYRDDADELGGEITSADRREAKRNAKQKQKRKAKAAELFRRQFGDDIAASDASSSRAALYKGEMGARQRRASRMQEAEPKGSSLRGLASGFSLSSLLESKRIMFSTVAVVCVLLGVFFLYGPTQGYYKQVREHDRLALEYQAVAERNEQLQSEVNSLQTDDGVRQRAHEQLGWVENGEQSANVSGLDLESSSANSDVVIANVSSDSIKAPTTWYSPVLDAVFGYTQGE